VTFSYQRVHLRSRQCKQGVILVEGLIGVAQKLGFKSGKIDGHALGQRITAAVKIAEDVTARERKGTISHISTLAQNRSHKSGKMPCAAVAGRA